MPLSEVEQAAIELQGKGSKNSYKYSLLADKGISGDLTGKSYMYKAALNNLEKSLAAKGVSGMRDVIYDSSRLVSPSEESELLRHASTDFQNPEVFNKLMSLREEAIKNFNPRRVPENSEIVKLANDY